MKYNLPARLKLALRYLAISQHFLRQFGSGRQKALILAPSGDYSNGGMQSLFKTAASRPGTANFFFLERFQNPAATEKTWAVESRASVLDCGSL
jgi:hypothetical protein